MLARLSNRIADIWIENSVISHEEKDVYKYGIELVLSILVNMCSLILISIVGGQPMAWIFYLLSFIPLRTAGGGYHAPTHATCILISSGMFCAAFLLSARLPDECAALACGVTAMLSLIIFWRFAPVAAVNKPLTKGEFLWNQKIARILVCIASLCVLLAIVFHCATYLSVKLFCCGEGISAVNLVIGSVASRHKRLRTS